MTQPLLQSLSLWKVTALGMQQQANGRINAQHFEGTAVDHTTWALIAIFASDNNSPLHVTLQDQFAGPVALQLSIRVRIPIDTFNAYEANQWIERADVRSPHDRMPVKSMWKITALGAANINPRNALSTPDIIWMVQSMHLSPQNNMAQCIRFLNVSQHRIDGSRHQPRYEMRKIAEYVRNGWLERVDVGHYGIDD